MVTIKKIIRSGGVCPYQIEAITDDNKYFYLRYRSGTLRFGVWDTPEKCDHTNYMFVKVIGGEYEGCADQELFDREMEGHVTFPNGFRHDVPVSSDEQGWEPKMSAEQERIMLDLLNRDNSSGPKNPS